MTNKIKAFPSKEYRPVHEYEFDTCAGCQSVIGDQESFTEVVLPDIDGMRKKHIALCEQCERVADSYGVFG